MSKRIEHHISQLLDEAEQRGACLASTDPSLRRHLMKRVRQRALIRPFRSLYMRAGTWKQLSLDERALHVLRGLQALHPDWVFCHDSAAIAWGLPLPAERTRAVHVASTTHARGNTPKTLVYHKFADGIPVATANGIRVTPFIETVYDVLARSIFPVGLAVADRALRLCAPTATNASTTARQLKAGLRELGTRHRNARRVAGVMGYASPRSESWAESVARALMIIHGFASPRLQVPFDNPLESGKTFRVDMLVDRADGTNVIIEVDGMLKYEDKRLLQGETSARVLAREQHREAALTLFRMPIVRLSYPDLMDSARFIRKLEAYGVPRSDAAAQAVSELGRSAPGTALSYCLVHIADDVIARQLAQRDARTSDDDSPAGEPQETHR